MIPTKYCARKFAASKSFIAFAVLHKRLQFCSEQSSCDRGKTSTDSLVAEELPLGQKSEQTTGACPISKACEQSCYQPISENAASHFPFNIDQLTKQLAAYATTSGSNDWQSPRLRFKTTRRMDLR